MIIIVHRDILDYLASWDPFHNNVMAGLGPTRRPLRIVIMSGVQANRQSYICPLDQFGASEGNCRARTDQSKHSALQEKNGGERKQ